MFPLQHSDEPFFQADPSIFQQELIVDRAFSDSRKPVTAGTKKRQRRSKPDLAENKDEEANNDQRKLRKIMHRDIERQRRQAMASLYASLRSLLPLEYVKGKRSISDHMHEAVNYIKHLEMNIKELRMQRDKLSRSSGLENGTSKGLDLPKSSVAVSSCMNGVEIIISCGFKEEERFPLSRVLMELHVMELNIVSYISTKTNDQRFVYRIQFEVNDLTYINLSGLQQRLVNVINFG